jgi:large subunit ribosomal protein L21
VGEKVELTTVLAASDGTQLQVGTPVLPGVSVSATVVKHVRGEKVVSFKQKRRKASRRKKGHRQRLTVLRVEGIAAGGTAAAT